MNDSTPAIHCPRCGAPLPTDAPEGLCPRCLAALQFGPETELTGEPKAAPIAPLPPEELAPHFPQLEILECLGRGGMGVVYKARQKSLNRVVALKLLAPERAKDAAFAERFTHEAHALAAMNHPHIVTVYDFGQAGGFYFLLMEFVDGVNLRQAMTTERFTPEQALAVVPPVCEALQYAHEHGIVHRDIKPENLLLDREGRVKIADFGIAKMLGDASTVNVADSQPAGTPQYMAPEQKDHQRADHRADIYSLGVVLYEMLTGERPKDKIEPPSKRVQVDVRIDEIVLRALEKTPELRFQTAAEMRTQVETITERPRLEQEASSPSAPPSVLGPAIIFAAIYLGYAWYLAATRSDLPERMASHFNGEGQANGWMNSSNYLVLMGAMPVIFATLFWLHSRCAQWFPGLLILPRRDYWLAPQHRPETAAVFLRWFLGLACIQTIFFAALHAQVLEANRSTPQHLASGPLLAVVIAFLLVLMIWIAAFISRVAEAGDARMTKTAGGRTDPEPATTQRRLFYAMGYRHPWSQRFLVISFLGFLGFLGCVPGWERLLVLLCFFGFLIVASLVERFAGRSAAYRESVSRYSWRRQWSTAALLVAFVVLMRVLLVGVYVVPTDSAAPEIPSGSRILVWKMAHTFAPGDMMAYRQDEHTYVGRVARAGADTITVNRNGWPDEDLPRSRVIGKVISVYWRGEKKAALSSTTPGPTTPPANLHDSTPSTEPVSDAAAKLAQEGWSLWGSGRPLEAIPKFREAVKLAPTDANSWNGLGWASLNSGKIDEAGKAFQKVLSLEPNHPAALNGLGQIYLARREYEKAEASLLKAAEQAAPAAWFGLARLYLLQGKFEEAQKWAQKVVDSGQGDAIATKMLEAAKEKHLSDGLRQMIEPPALPEEKSSNGK